MCVVAVVADDYTETHCKDKKQAIVHLFEWSHDSVADECLKVLGPKGYCGVQVSPPNEHIQGGQWWTRCSGDILIIIFYLLLIQVPAGLLHSVQQVRQQGQLHQHGAAVQQRGRDVGRLGV